MEDKNVNVSFGGFFTLLGLLFIALKLCNVIAWPWVWGLAPIWIPIVLSILIIVFAVLLGR